MAQADAAARALQSAMETAHVRFAVESESLAAPDASDVAIDGSTTNSDGGGEDAEDKARSLQTKKRKSTHQVRKLEKEALVEEIERLQAQLRLLEDETNTEKIELHRSVAKHAQLTYDVEVNQMALAGTQSMLSAFSSSGWKSPLSTYIHLTVDPAKRRECLAALYPRKIDVTTKFMLERSRFLDLRREHCHTESCELPSGEFVFTRFEVTPFGRTFSAKRIFDEMMLFMSHQEISISENLGLLTVVDAEDTEIPAVRQTRLLSSFDDGLVVVSNGVVFSKYEDAGSDSHGIGCIDFVDRDDLYPDDPSERLRKDLSACAFVAVCPADREGEPPVVTLTRWMSVRLRRPAFAISKTQEIAVRDSMRVWGTVMIKVMQERLGIR